MHKSVREMFPALSPSESSRGKSNALIRLAGNQPDGTPLQYSCLENPMDGGAWKAAVHEVAEGRTRLSDFTSLFTFHARVLEWVAIAFSGLKPSSGFMGERFRENRGDELCFVMFCLGIFFLSFF